LTAYRFCRSDDMGLLVEAHERCRGPEDAGEPVLDRAGFKRLIRDLDLWCSSCMVAFEGREPVGVLLGAKRPEATLVYALRVHPEHRRQGHGRHLLTSLSQKLAILGPPRLVAEVPADREAARAAFAACGWTIESRLTDWRRPATRESAASGMREALAPVTCDDLAAAGLLEAGLRCWQRDLPSLAKQSERLSGLAFHSPDRIEAWALWSQEIPPTVETPRGASPPEVSEGTHGSLRVDGAAAGDAPRGVSTVEGASLLAVGCTPGVLGRIGLAAVLDEIGIPLLLARATPEELDAGLLAELGFERGGEHLLYTSRAQAA
jgi:GNAT superfamily N-acetyltransferase